MPEWLPAGCGGSSQSFLSAEQEPFIKALDLVEPSTTSPTSLPPFFQRDVLCPASLCLPCPKMSPPYLPPCPLSPLPHSGLHKLPSCGELVLAQHLWELGLLWHWRSHGLTDVHYGTFATTSCQHVPTLSCQDLALSPEWNTPTRSSLGLIVHYVGSNNGIGTFVNLFMFLFYTIPSGNQQ